MTEYRPKTGHCAQLKFLNLLKNFGTLGSYILSRNPSPVNCEQETLLPVLGHCHSGETR